MSLKSKSTLPPPSKSLPPKPAFKPKPHDPDNIDARLQHLNKNVLPRSPYLLTIPSDCPYRVHEQQANNWKTNSPFDADEEGLQYMSFLYRDWDDSIIVARGDWDNEGSIMENGARPRTEARSGTSTPSHWQGQKKKITLNDYKSKPKAGISGQGAQVNSQNGVKTESDSDNKAVLKPPPHPPASHGQKRPLDAPSEDRKPNSVVSNHVAPPAKKIKTSPPPKSPLRRPNLQSESGQIKAESAKGPVKLPPLLSPTLPASIEEGLAKLPKSPLELEGTSGHKKSTSIASTASDKKSLPSSNALSSSNTNNLKSTPGGTSDRSNLQATTKLPSKNSLTPKISQLKTAANSKTQSLGESPKKTPPNSEPKPRVAAPEAGVKAGRPNGVAGASSFFQSLRTGKPASPALAPTSVPRAEAVKPKNSLVTKLKYGKNHRKTIERILQMKSRPKKISPNILNERPNDMSDKGIDRGSLNEKPKLENPERQRGAGEKRRDEERDRERHQVTTKENDKVRLKDPPRQAEKRPRPADGERSREPPAKRLKPRDSLDGSSNSRTPLPTSFKSPALSSQGSAHKPQVSPPKKDLKSVAMRRVDSGDSNVRTPQGAVRHGTPTAPSSAEKLYGEERGSSSSSSKGRLKDIEAWRAENKKYSELGRKMKHEADSLLKPKSEGARVEDYLAKQGTALAIETILCYMLAFNAADQSRNLQRLPGDVLGWRSVLPYLDFVTAKAKRYPYLHGLCFQVGAVCREIIHTLELDRLKNDPLPVAAAEEVQPPTPGTDHNPSTGEIDNAAKAATYRKKYLVFQAELVDNAHDAKRSWADGAAELSVDDLQSSFPQTWAHRSKRPLPRTGDKLVPGQYQGGYFLPLGAFSEGLESVRFAARVLGEWTKREGVDWKGRLGI